MSSPVSYTENQIHSDQERLKAALFWEKHNEKSEHHVAMSEHHVARYVLLIILKVFRMQDWNIVPQFYTIAGKWPDIVLESFERRPEKEGNLVFVPRVFIEVKHKNKADDTIEQLLKSIVYNQSPILSSKGYLIGITGTKWTIMDFQLVIPDAAKKPKTVLHNFYENPYNMGTGGRPEPSKTYSGREAIDISTEEGFKDMAKPLRWIAEKTESRDFADHMPHVQRLPKSLTTSTLGEVVMGDEHALDEFSFMSNLF